MITLISDGELVLLSMCITNLEKDAERRRGTILCTDGKTRRFGKEEAIDLLDRLGTVAGYQRGFFKENGKALAREARL